MVIHFGLSRGQRFQTLANVVGAPSADQNMVAGRLVAVESDLHHILARLEREPLKEAIEVVYITDVGFVDVDLRLATGVLRIDLDPN